MLKVCAVRDTAIEAYMNPIFVPALGLAVRSFTDEINRPQGQFNAHPGDFDLWHIADFDDHSGKFFNIEPPRRLAVGKEVLLPTS